MGNILAEREAIDPRRSPRRRRRRRSSPVGPARAQPEKIGKRLAALAEDRVNLARHALASVPDGHAGAPMPCGKHRPRCFWRACRSKVPPGGFLQPSREGEQALVDLVLRGLPPASEPDPGTLRRLRHLHLCDREDRRGSMRGGRRGGGPIAALCQGRRRGRAGESGSKPKHRDLARRPDPGRGDRAEYDALSSSTRRATGPRNKRQKSPRLEFRGSSLFPAIHGVSRGMHAFWPTEGSRSNR